ncbi:MAG: alpha/beta hydrolase [Actinomycetes bacterium]
MAELHPQCAAFLKMGEGQPDVTQMGTFYGRSNGHSERDLSGPIDPSVHIEHLYFTSPTADLPISIFTPPGAGPFNGMVYFHGGGWVFNYIRLYEAQLADMAKRTNSIIVSVNYQKAPEHKFPIPFDDCYAAWEWVNEHAAEIGITTGKIGIGGDSAGGNLASGVAIKIRDVNKYPLAYQWLIYPCNGVDFDTPSYLANATNYGLTRAGMIWLWDQYLSTAEDRTNPYAVPLSGTNFVGLAPAIVLTAGFDVLHDDGELYKEKLVAAGVPVAYKELPDMIHGFFNYGKYIEQGITIRDYFADEINKALK